jgi:hypothetical protein
VVLDRNVLDVILPVQRAYPPTSYKWRSVASCAVSGAQSGHVCQCYTAPHVIVPKTNSTSVISGKCVA